MHYETLIGLAASVLTGTSLIPQLVKLLKEKKTGGVSFIMLGVLFTGLALWVYYGILKHDWIIIVSNGFSMLINLWISVLTIHYRKRASRKR
jgi:MtN3 and saliva related transmembrane protein